MPQQSETQTGQAQRELRVHTLEPYLLALAQDSADQAHPARGLSLQPLPGSPVVWRFQEPGPAGLGGVLLNVLALLQEGLTSFSSAGTLYLAGGAPGSDPGAALARDLPRALYLPGAPAHLLLKPQRYEVLAQEGDVRAALPPQWPPEAVREVLRVRKKMLLVLNVAWLLARLDALVPAAEPVPATEPVPARGAPAARPSAEAAPAPGLKVAPGDATIHVAAGGPMVQAGPAESGTTPARRRDAGMELCDQPLHLLHEQRLAKAISTEEIARSVLARIEKVEPRVKAYLLLAEGVLERARAADARLREGQDLPALAGMPLAVKDIFCTQGLETTCGSRILKGFRPPYDATVVAKLKAHGLNLVGKTNLDEFAMGSSTENSAFGPTHNPWDLERVPGGSSGGSAAAVAAGEALAALGTDTGGSIRQPAAFTSLVGLKPTYGRVSRYGMVAYASSLDQGGPLTRDVRDCALLLNAICGHDPRDSTSADRPVPDYTRALGGDLKGRRIGLVKEFQEQGTLQGEVAGAFAQNLKTLQDLGAEVVEISIPTLNQAIAVYYILAPCEASSNLGRFDGIRYGLRVGAAGGLQHLYTQTREQGFGAEVKRRIMLGTFALSAGYYDAYYVRALRIRRLLREDFLRAFGQVHLIASPTSPVPAFKLGERLQDPLQMYLIDAYTLPVNLAGIPAISIPGGFTPQGLPLGLQLMAPHFEEERLLQAASAFESATDYHQRRPALV